MHGCVTHSSCMPTCTPAAAVLLLLLPSSALQGLAFAEKIGVRTTKKAARKLQVAGLKSLY